MGVKKSLVMAPALLVGLCVLPVSAQIADVGDPLESYWRVLELTGRVPVGSASIRPLMTPDDSIVTSISRHPWEARLEFSRVASEPSVVSRVEAGVRSFVNSRHPSGQNDGAVWQGKGLTMAVDAGATLRWGPVSAAIRPSLIYTQNADFELAPVTVPDQSVYGYPWRAIDVPQRFGPDPFWSVDPGQSEIRVDAFGATMGISSRNLWFGPGVRSGILMSNNAAGIPHLFVGTRGPRHIGVGQLEAKWIWGRLEQSGWFDPTVENDQRFLTGLVGVYSPSFLPGLSVGAARVFYGRVPADGTPFSDFFMVFQGVQKKTQASPDNPTGDDDTDQLLSLFGRWALPESGFEVYVEWARNDHAWDVTDFLQEPEHSQGYTLGLQKAEELEEGRILVLSGELTHLERDRTFLLRGSPVYYAHGIVRQGYTHRGEVIGAGIGPGGVQQYFGLDLYADWGRGGVMLRRRVHDNDAYYSWALQNDSNYRNHNVSFDIGLNALVFRGDFQLGGGIVYTREVNRYFFGPNVNNLNLSLSARWRPGAS